MSRLADKLQKVKSQLGTAQKQVWQLEDEVERLEAKQLKRQFKRRRKAYRKKLVKDPALRLMVGLAHDMYCGPKPGRLKFQGILGQLRGSERWPDDTDDPIQPKPRSQPFKNA